MKKTWIFIIILLAAAMLGACNLPGDEDTQPVSQADLILTAAEQTVQARHTEDALAQPTATWTMIPSNTPQTVPSNTPIPTKEPTQAEAACDVAEFVTDVTISDGTAFQPGEIFTKTWRFKNNGSCAWTSGYSIIFLSGDSMEGPASQSLTTGVVEYGDVVDISVELTAPDNPGEYTGYWGLRNASGVTFASNFWVKIEVEEVTGPTSTATVKVTVPAVTDTKTLTNINSGSVREDGSVEVVASVGDTAGDEGQQAFFAFDISGIPANAIIVEVSVDFSSFSTKDNPFGTLGCLRGYAGSFFPLDSGDYTTSPGTAVIRWCDEFELQAPGIAVGIKDSLQNSLGDSTYELHLQFNETESDDDGDPDQVQFGVVSMTVKYAK
jgi:hypothetical protein